MNESVYVHKTAVVDEGVTIGAGCKIWHHCHVRKGAVLGSNVSLGKGVYVDSGVVIGNNTRVQNGVSIYRGVTIEDDVFLGPHCNFTNDLFPRANPDSWQVIPTLVRRWASIGSNATIICGVTVGMYSMISVGAVVTEDTLPFSLMIGHPARLKGFVCPCGKKMVRGDDKDTLNFRYRCSYCSQEIAVSFELR